METHAKVTFREIAEVVERGEKLASSVEHNLERAYSATLKMVGTIIAERGVDIVEPLEAGELSNEARAIAGSIAEASKRFYVLHQRLRDIAEQNGVRFARPAATVVELTSTPS